MASSVLIVVFSIILYNYIKISIFENLNDSLLKEVRIVANSNITLLSTETIRQNFPHSEDTQIEIVSRKNNQQSVIFEQTKKNDRYFLSVYYLHELKYSTYIKITKDITSTALLLENILLDIFVINLSAIFLILFYAMLLSRMLLLPIKTLNHKLARMDESFLQHIDTKSLPEEFMPLGKSINKLIDRIQTFIKYQKELFVGIAHELKTPLAVMKTKNEVTLIKKRDEEKYIETIKNNNIAINEMNKMISAILEIGRQEGAQFEEPVNIDLIKFLKEKIENFKILSHQEKIEIEDKLTPKEYKIKIQTTLLTHILQNFIQNAIKFSPPLSTITIKSSVDKNGFLIEVIDEGGGIDESKDYFAPFKRYGNKGGAGLGLFLAKGAADAIGATIKLTNRNDDKKGCNASVYIPFIKKVNATK
ncbi:MAG: sensor histidine kinase [Campylobacteraceae bacterium]